jgi:hypothetical protein
VEWCLFALFLSGAAAKFDHILLCEEEYTRRRDEDEDDDDDESFSAARRRSLALRRYTPVGKMRWTDSIIGAMP